MEWIQNANLLALSCGNRAWLQKKTVADEEQDAEVHAPQIVDMAGNVEGVDHLL
jgi:hypothetical protein